jgi:uncharacterized protein YdeI (YjbR/CyaY-like superfamily)
MQRLKTPESYIASHPEYKTELTLLRKICLSSGLTETVKWGAPVYCDQNNKNVVGLGAFKSYVGLWFFQGVFLKDAEKKMMNAQEGTTRGMRQWRFADTDDIRAHEKLIRAYIQEATANSMAGKEIKPKRATAKKLVIPPELTKALSSDQALKKNFTALTPFKQREYAEYILEAKQAATKIKRLEKIVPMILEGRGLNDRYR